MEVDLKSLERECKELERDTLEALNTRLLYAIARGISNLCIEIDALREAVEKAGDAAGGAS